MSVTSLRFSRLWFALAAAAVAACGSDDPDDFPTTTCADMSTTCIEVAGGDAEALQAAVNSIEDGTTLVLGTGTFEMSNALTIRTASTQVIGQGIDETTLDFGPTTAQVNGIDVQGDAFLVEDLTVLDAKKDGIRVENSDGVVFRRIRATWTNPGLSENGAYGIYPVKSQNVLVEDSRAENASDAGLYVGQCQHVIVRNNTVSGNVAGLEIENTQYADVYGNTAEYNTAGIVVFDLPGNPIVGRDVRLRDNTIRSNNTGNFAPGGTVKQIPAGTGTFAMASRRVEITGNTYQDNNTVDIAIISGLVVQSLGAEWELETAELLGDWDDLNLLEGDTAGTITNFRSENILVAGNSHSGSGTSPDILDPNNLGLLLGAAYGANPTDSVLYDTIGETAFDSTDAGANSNDNHLCVGANTEGTFASMHLEAQDVLKLMPFFRPAAPFAPFDCTALDGDPIADVELP